MKNIKLYTHCFFLSCILLITACNKNKIPAPSNGGAKAPIVLITPKNELVTPNVNQTFSWTPVDGVTIYELKIASPSFANPSNIIFDSVVTTSIVKRLMQQGYYQWCVNTLNPNSPNVYSDTSKLTIH